ncbi:MAG: hypothetical protein U5J99_04445 [Parvularculaceae bacterium]|nr:hypothetical protein [Parvularculaceae bacterium]
MRAKSAIGLALIFALTACSKAKDADGVSGDAVSGSATSAQVLMQPSSQSSDAGPGNATAAASTSKTNGGGLVAEPSDVEGFLSITIKWISEIVTGDPNSGITTVGYNRATEMECPLTSNSEQSFSYFTLLDGLNDDDPFAPTGSYQQWLNERCAGTITLNDTYHFNDPTTAGEEPVVRTTGTRPFDLSDIPYTIETDLIRARTRYQFISPSAEGFQRHAAEGYPAKLETASSAPMATMDFTLEGPIGGGKEIVDVQGGKLYVDWTFTRGRSKI